MVCWCSKSWRCRAGSADFTETARLVSVKNGACLLFVPLGKDELAQWTQGLARQVARLALMLAVAQTDALPISVLNLRAAILTPVLATMESALTRLVELRLGAAPNVVLLERRRLGDAAFERSLEAADLPPLWNGAVLIDGSFELSSSHERTVAVTLRLRRQDGSKTETALVMGSANSMPELAVAVADAVLSKLSQPPSNVVSKPVAEASEFFDEAVWAWRGSLFDAAEEALSAALALGEKSADASALETWLLTERASPQGVFYQGKYLKRDTPSPAEQSALFEQAFVALAENKRAGGRLQKIDDNTAANLREGDLRHRLIESASEFLHANDESPKPLEIASLRAYVHDAAGMTAEGNAMPYSLAMASRHGRDWARDSGELMAFYEKLLRSDHKWLMSLLKYFPREPEAALGPRFRRDAQAVGAWEEMWKRLAADSTTKLRALLILADAAETPAQAATYREYLREVGDRALELFQRHQLGIFLEADRTGRSFHEKFEPERTALFIRLCDTLPARVTELYHLADRLKIPAGQEQRVWTAFTKYRERCLQTADEKERNECVNSFTFWQGLLLRNNPAIQVAPSPSGLTVRRFWNYYAQPEADRPRLDLNEIVAAENSVWLIPAGKPDGEIYEVTLPDFRTTVHHIEGADTGATLAITPDAIWMEHGVYPGREQPMQISLVRRDRRGGGERTWPLPRGGRLDVVNGRVFIDFGHDSDGGLAELDQATGEFRVLVSARRNPPQSPFDAKPAWSSAGVLAGPKGEPCVAVRAPEGGLFSIGGEWKKIAPTSWSGASHFGAQSLLFNTQGEALFVDPARVAPEWCMAGAKSSAELRAKVAWERPANFSGGEFQSGWAFRDREIFATFRDAQGAHWLRWWFPGSPREGVAIPLRFELPAADRALLEKRRGDFTGFITFEAICDPSRALHAFKILATPAGLILTHKAHGFWFIPNSDLENSAKEIVPVVNNR